MIARTERPARVRWPRLTTQRTTEDSSDARFVAHELIRTGTVERGFLGLRGRALSELSRKERRAAGTDRAVGILVTYVRPSSPAADAFRNGDVIVAMSGREVATYDALRARVARTKPGSEVEFLGTVEPNPAILDNHCHTYLVRDCRKVGEPQPDPGEDLEVVVLPRTEMRAAVADGRITHALVVCALWWLEDWEARTTPGS